MQKWFRAVCTKEIHWPEKDGRTYRQGDAITVLDTDVELLRSAGVIGDIKRVDPGVEMAVAGPPEDASKNYRRRGR